MKQTTCKSIWTFGKRKETNSLNIQAVCGPNLRFLTLTLGDQEAHRMSLSSTTVICVAMKGSVHRGHLLGDAEHPCTPLSNSQSCQEMHYNQSHILIQSCIKSLWSSHKKVWYLSKQIQTDLKNTTPHYNSDYSPQFGTEMESSNYRWGCITRVRLRNRMTWMQPLVTMLKKDCKVMLKDDKE